jgi:TP901 family phage tail tape measure protein
LGKIPKSNVDTVAGQLVGLDKRLKSGGKVAESYNQKIKKIIDSTNGFTTALKTENRELAIGAARLAVSQHRIRNAAHAMDAAKAIFRDMFTVTGALNNALSIMVSRFGTMILLFGAIQQIRKLTQAMGEAAEEMDTNYNRVASIVVSSSMAVGDAMEELSYQVIDFGLRTGVSFDQTSNAIFFLASAGRSAEQIFHEFDDAMRLVLATSKDLTASQEELKISTETFAALMNVYGESISNIGTQAVTARRLSELMFEAFKTQQILLGEFAIGLQYAGTQAKLMDISIEELIASIAVLNTGMLKGSKAGTGYANALRDATQKADKLEEVFGISVKNIGKDFSFLETVVKGIRDRIDETGVTLELMQELFEVFNIRGARAVLTLAVQYDRATKLLGDFSHASEDLTAALDKVNNSLAAQKVRHENIKQVALSMFASVITGGLGYAKILKLMNNDSAVWLKALARASALILAFTGNILGLALAARAIVKNLIILNEFANAAKKSLTWSELTQDWVDLKNAMVNTYKTIQQLEKYADGYIGKLELAESVTSDSINEGLKDIERLSKSAHTSLDEYYDSLVKITESQVRLFSKTGTKLKFDLDTEILYRELELQFEILKHRFEGTTGTIDIDFEIDATDLNRLYSRLTRFNASIEKSGIDILSFTSFAQAYFRDLDVFMTVFNKDIQDAFTVIDASYGNMNKFGEVLKNLLYPKAEGLKAEDLLEGLAARLRKFDKKLKAEGVSDIRDLLGMGDKAKQATLLNEYLLIVQDFYSKDMAIIDKNEDERIKSMFETHKRMIKQEKEYFNQRRTLINNQRYEDFIKSGGRLDEVMSVSFLPAISKRAETALANTQKALLARVNREAAAILAENFQKRIDQSVQFGGEIINLEGKTAKEIVRLWVARFGEIDQFTKHERNELAAIIKDSEEFIRGIIVRDLSWEERDILERVGKAEKIIAEAEREILALKADPDITGSAEARMRFLQSEIDKITNEGFRDLISGAKNVQEEVDRRVKEAIRSMLEEMGLSLDQINDIMKKLSDESSENLIKMKRKFEDVAITANNLASILGDISNVMSDDTGAKKMVASLGLVSDSISDVTQSIGDMAEAWKKEELNAFQWVSSLTNIISSVVRTITSIIDVYRGPAGPSPLDQEFLSPETAGRLSPDYGQSRVVYNNNSLATSFQFLDVSQLTPHTQRSIAEGFADELAEILKSRGDI